MQVQQGLLGPHRKRGAHPSITCAACAAALPAALSETDICRVLPLLCSGDIVGVRGGIKRTEKGELSVMVTSLEVGLLGAGCSVAAAAAAPAGHAAPAGRAVCAAMQPLRWCRLCRRSPMWGCEDRAAVVHAGVTGMAAIVLMAASSYRSLCAPPQVLTKSLLPLPDKWHGLADVEQRYRKR